MAYEANRDGDKEAQKQRNDANNTKNIRNAADVAIASKNPYAMAAGAAVKGADKLTGGKASETLGKAMSKVGKTPGGKHLQDLSNKLSESGASDAIGQAASAKSGMGGGAGGVGGAKAATTGPTAGPANTVSAANKTTGGEQSGSLPSSRTGNNQPSTALDGLGRNKSDSFSETQESSTDGGGEAESAFKGRGMFVGVSPMVKVVVISMFPFLIILLTLVLVVSVVTGMFGDYEDALGMSQTTGDDTGGLNYNASPEQQAFYDRINSVKMSYQSSGKTVDTLKVVAVFHILRSNGAQLNYDDIDDASIREVADAMFDGNSYNEETFKSNLINNIFPKYLPNSSQYGREKMADDVFNYIERYYSLIHKDTGGTCASGGSCTYEIKGYYIQGKGEVTESITVQDLYVRLMQCGTGNGHNYGGTFGQPLEGEELVPFEKYILGVAYAEIGDGQPEHAVKAQMVAARSYILARHKDMGGWRTLKQEDNRWILQVAACTQDQVYCDPDQGCSTDKDGQWGQVHSGLNHGKTIKKALSEDDAYRKYADETAGEVLVNKNGFIIYAGYLSTETNMFTSLAKQGLNYKQILLQVYNQGSRNYGAADVLKGNCSGGSSSACGGSGPYSEWKQYEGPWIGIQLGNSGKTIKQIGCLVTSVAIQIARSGVETSISDFNPGTFVEFLNKNGGFVSGGNFVWGSATKAAPKFEYKGKIGLAGQSRSAKLSAIKNLVSTNGNYAVCEVKGNTGQHWVAVESVTGNTINMYDPGSSGTSMWDQYNWANTSECAYYNVG